MFSGSPEWVVYSKAASSSSHGPADVKQEADDLERIAKKLKPLDPAPSLISMLLMVIIIITIITVITITKNNDHDAMTLIISIRILAILITII